VRLTVVSPYGERAASTRVRAYHWLRHTGIGADRLEYVAAATSSPRVLAAHPYGVVRAERRLRALAKRGTETLLLQREASPLSRGVLETDLLRSARHGVYDFDDALQWDLGQGGLARRLAPKAPKCVAGVRAADVVIAGNDLLADWASQWAHDVVVIPSCVEPADYIVKTSYVLQDTPRIGWLGSASAERHLAIAADGLLETYRRNGARLTVMSSGSRSLGSLDQMVDRVSWAPDSFASELASWDIAIAPLAESALARGKCAYKLLQYAAAGLPVVGSPVGANSAVLARLGATAAGTGDWVDALHEVLGSEPRRRASGQVARQVVTTSWSYASWAPAWTAALGISAPPAASRG
jgi:glycosyltransferase involved in cell wall biosynthesis